MEKRYNGYDLDILSRNIIEHIGIFLKEITGKDLSTYNAINMFMELRHIKRHVEYSILAPKIDKLIKTTCDFEDWIDAPQDHSLFNVVGYHGINEIYIKKLNDLLRQALKFPAC